MPEHGHARVLWHDLAEQLEALGDELRAEKNCPGYIPAWSSKASDQIVLYGIGYGDHDNGNDWSLA